MTGDISGVITGISVAHDRATVDEITAAGATDQQADVRQLLAHGPVEEAFALHTCNRTEAYVVTDDPAAGRAAFGEFAPGVRESAVQYFEHDDSLRHLLRVATGLESMVIGEDQILGQVRTAYEDAKEAGGIGPLLGEAVAKAIHVGERARTETAINEGIVSLGSAAARLAGEHLDLTDATAAIVGTGQMGRLAAEALDRQEIDQLLLINRTVETAAELGAELAVPTTVESLSTLDGLPQRADVIITTTASDEPLLTPETVEVSSLTVVIDIAQPRDVKPAVGEIDGVIVYDLDSLEAITEQTRQQRRQAAAAVERIIDQELDRLLTQFKRKRADAVIGAMYEGAERIKAEELDRALTQMETHGDVPPEQREILEDMADALVSRLLAAPTQSLREAAAEDDWTTIYTALQLFNPTMRETEQAMPAETRQSAETD